MGTKIKKSIVYAALIILAISCILPFVLMMVNATRSGSEIMASFTFKPGTSLEENWATVSGYFDLFKGFWNSLVVAVPATLLTAYFSGLTAFALGVYKFKGSNFIFGVIVIFMMIPGQLGLLGFYNLVRALGLIDSYIPLIIPAIAAPGTVFFLRQYVKSVLSPSLLEAARIDGASEIRIFHQIVLPIMSPGIATMAIGAFIGNWNSYLVPLILLNSPDKFTLPVMIASLNASQDVASNQGAIYLAVAISVIPVMIFFCFCSRYIISGISAGGVKE
ncbi:MAG: sugar ABC transporter permease [Epulopiscium sp. Nele67-Bin002]|nr:MAG: sugar ABC transporter permease [Epulopiscium sp. Nele67-Bin002]OON93617.1 MAG: sugar ABC transporter permease [Epulopiscium sp. Nele67-Bin001]